MKYKNTGDNTMFFRIRIIPLVLLPLAALALSACDTSKGTSNQDSIVTGTGMFSNFDPANGVIPFPNDLLFQGSTDGTVNIPVDDPTALSDPQVAINGLDGFSTSAPISTGFLGALDPASVASAVRVFEVTLSSSPAPGGAVVALNSELALGIDFVATLSSVDRSASTLVVVPLKPLKPKTSYHVVVTNSLKTAQGNTVKPSTTYALAKGADPLVDGTGASVVPALSDTQANTLEPLRQLTSFSEATVAANASPALAAADIVMSWTFTTQSTTEVLETVRGSVRTSIGPGRAGFLPTPFTQSPNGMADIHVGNLVVDYFLAPSDTSSSPSNDPTALASYWKDASGNHLSYLLSNVMPQATGTQTIPMLVSIPRTLAGCPGAVKPVAGWPVVIFQHGVTRDRGDMIAVADSLAMACMAVVAIDMPMHGITGNETDGRQVFRNQPASSGVVERTFDLDLMTQTTIGTVPGPDGIIDETGTHFVNLANLLNTRDNIRQAVADLFALTRSIDSGALTDGVNTFDASRIYFLGHSLGAMVGTTFLALEPEVKAAALVAGGISLPKILDGSTVFGPIFGGGLAANGVVKGTPDYESFLAAAQTVVDSGDPVNHASAAAVGRGILFQEIVGDGAGNPSDLYVPNTVPDGNDNSGTVPAPLAGTEPQLALMGLAQQNSTVLPGATDLAVVTKFTTGSHTSLLDPGPSLAVTTEMQTQIANFFGSDGKALVVTDGTLLQPPPAPAAP